MSEAILKIVEGTTRDNVNKRSCHRSFRRSLFGILLRQLLVCYMNRSDVRDLYCKNKAKSDYTGNGHINGLKLSYACNLKLSTRLVYYFIPVRSPSEGFSLKFLNHNIPAAQHFAHMKIQHNFAIDYFKLYWAFHIFI